MPAGPNAARIPLHAITAISPSSADRMRVCPLQAGLARASETQEFVLGNPLAWLGLAYHEVLERLHRTSSPIIDDEVERLWNAAVRKCYEHTRNHPLNRRFGPPETWPRYFAAAAMAKIRAHEIPRHHNSAPHAMKTGGTASNFAEHSLGACDGKLVGRPDAVRNHDIVDYKTGDLFESDAPTAVKESYLRQLRLYAVLIHENLGWWPQRGVLAPMTGTSVSVELAPAECLNEASAAIRLLDQYNALIKRGTSLNALASPSPTACNACAFQIVCEPFWTKVTPAWAATAYGRAVEGRVLGPPASIQQGAAYLLALDIERGTEPPQRASLAPLSPAVHDAITSIATDDRVRAVGLRQRPDGSLHPTMRTVIAKTVDLPEVTAAQA